MDNLVEMLTSSLLSKESTKSIAKASGSNTKDVTNVVSSALPVLLQSMINNSSDEKGANSLSTALESHATKTTKSSSLLDNLDLGDGMKIIGHLLGNDQKTVEKNIAKNNNVSSNQVQSILSALAPLLMNKVGVETKKSSNSGNLAGTLISMLTGGSGSSGGFDLGSLFSMATKDSDGDGKSDILETITGFLGKK